MDKRASMIAWQITMEHMRISKAMSLIDAPDDYDETNKKACRIVESMMNAPISDDPGFLGFLEKALR
jgi:hypothetical protein